LGKYILIVSNVTNVARIPIERQARQPLRDGLLVAVGIAGLLVVEFGFLRGVAMLETGPVHGFLFGCALGTMCSGISRATTEQALVSTLALGVGFAAGAVVDIL
jgi:hypothetical protein